MRTDLGVDARSMARGAGVNLIGSAGATVLGFIVTVTITYLVSPRSIGLVAMGTTVVGLAVIPALLGLDTGVIRFVARRASLGDERGTRASIQAAISVTTVTSLALTAVLWWKAPEISDRFFRKPEATQILRLVSLSLPALAVSRVTLAAIQGYGVMTYPAWLGIARRVLRLAAVLPLVAIGLETRALALAAVVSAWGSCLLAFWFLFRVHPSALSPIRGWPLVSLLNFSVPQLLTSLLFYAILWTDTLFLGRFGTSAEVGVYSVLATLLTPATVVSTAMGEMFSPRIAAEDGRGDRRALAKMLKRVTHWNTTVSIPFFAVLALVPTGLLSVFGGAYETGATALAILATGQLINTAAGPLGQVLNMSGRQYLTMTNNALVAGLNATACIFLIPRYGMTGAACSTASSLTVVNLIKLLEVRLLFSMHPFGRQTLRVVSAGVIAVGLALPVALLPDWPSPAVQAIAGGFVLFAAYGLLAWALALTGEDRELLALGRARIQQGLRPARLVVGG
jgi:O-antigen/teichoic acid export membrane protein